MYENDVPSDHLIEIDMNLTKTPKPEEEMSYKELRLKDIREQNKNGGARAKRRKAYALQNKVTSGNKSRKA